ncbi:HAMP domain-containing protein, partial [bacterium]|nr:HAMP domain-containing protein [bacterium]
MRQSLRRRILLLTVVLLTLSMVLITLLHVTREHALVTDQAKSNRRHLTETFAISITNSLLYEELGLIEEGGLIENYIEEWMRKEELHIQFIHVMDTRGRIIASSRLTEYGKAPDDPHILNALSVDTTVVRRLQSDEYGDILDITAPLTISTRSWGHLRMGYSMAPLQTELYRLWVMHGLAALGMILLSSLIVLPYLRSLLKPLAQLRDFVQTAAEEPWRRTELSSADEIGDLARNFNAMLDQIEAARELERETQEKFYQTERVANIGKLAAGVAHEIRNPLAGILNLAENLERYRVNHERQKEYIDAIVQGLQRIEKTVDGLMSFARQTPFAPTSIDISSLIKETLRLVRYPLRKARIDVHTILDEEAQRVFGDMDQLRQVLLNLILNAVQAIENNGRITITTSPEGSDQVRISVADDGIGIPRERIVRIFDPFYT